MQKLTLVSLIILLIAGCQDKKTEEKVDHLDFYQTQLFKDVQLADVFEDSKTFVDCVPNRSFSEIIADYDELRQDVDFDLKEFVKDNFQMPYQPTTGFETDTSNSMVEHIQELWPVLTREPKIQENLSSLISLNEPYVVPGGRFREIYYWDSYFTIEGLLNSGKNNLATNMLDNFSFLIDSLGFVPNGNRAYYKGRSQPPFYSLIVSRVADDNRDKFIGYLPYLLKEYNFWMKGVETLKMGEAKNRVVRLDGGEVLNRYWDDLQGPRPESYKEDYELVIENNLDSTNAYRHLRAGAESGWDYSSRWFADQENLSTIETTNIIPVDLNCLLYHLELKIAQGYNWKEELDSAQYFLNLAADRKEAINKILWDDEVGFYTDYNFINKSSTNVYSLAAAYPLYFNIASKKQAKYTSAYLVKKFLYPGGFVTTLNETGQQWDYPNGWAPLQWITVMGLFNYNYNEEGLDAVNRWLKVNRKVYQATGKMMEKYNVVDTTLIAGGGEYPLQDGFGWTNGIAISFQKILSDKDLITK